MQVFRKDVLLPVSFSLLLIGACSTSPPDNVNLSEAERAVQRAENDERVLQYAPVPLQEAQKNLQLAQHSWREEGEEQREKVDHLAYLARQQALIAIERGATEAETKEIRAASDRRDQLVLQSREHEIQRLRQETADLQTMVRDLKTEQTERGLILTMDEILFDFGEASLNPGGRKAVQNLATWLKENSDRKILVEGYTDASGPEDYNRQLSQERAAAVERVLIQSGVASSRIEATGYGEQYPVASNDSSAGRQQNRRVEIVIADSGETPERREEYSASSL